MARTGHKTRSMLDRYNIVSTRDLEHGGFPSRPVRANDAKRRLVDPLLGANAAGYYSGFAPRITDS